MEQLQQLKNRYASLPVKEQRMVIGIACLIFITLFYLVVWEPINDGLKHEQQKQQSQKEIIIWMQQAAIEVKSLRAAGSRGTIRNKNKPATLVIEQAINNAGLKPSVIKIESSGKNGARVTLNEASFNQVLVWLNTLTKHNGIRVVSANFERAGKPGRTNIRLTLERM
ncbi:MAG: type II secretion system protein M [Gammaproteobacteria bacterium]|nr:type II secretion system protein M [Gammaproteobacteria bacterium]